MIRKIANLAINKGGIKDSNTLQAMGRPLTSADAVDEYIAVTTYIDEGK